MPLIFIWLATIVVSAILFFKQKYSQLKNYGVNHLRPIPPLGTLTRTTLRLEHLAETINNVYHTFPEDRFVGHYEFVNKVIILKDLDLIKKVGIKDFDHFVDRRLLFSEENADLFGKNLFALKGDKWRDMRTTLSPAFTSSKIRLMIPFMTEVGAQMNAVLHEKIKSSKGGYLDIETTDLTTRYANDVIASCAFGVSVNSHADEGNEFYMRGKQATSLSFWQLMKFFGFSSFPKIMNALSLEVFPKHVSEFFRGLVSSVMKDREDRKVIRNDMIHLLMEAKKGGISHDTEITSEAAGFATVEESAVGHAKPTRVWTDDDLVAQAVLFFFAGFDTVSTAMTFMLYEMALNPEIQEKLVDEIKKVDTDNKGEIEFNSIQKMQYMDQVVSETLRMWCPIIALDRICLQDYNLGKANSEASKDYIVKKGEGVWIPCFALQRDPKYFSNPTKFDPDRFSPENQSKIHPLSYLPFGIGPRNCIGSRFALCEVKVMIYQLLREFEVSPNEKTTIPPKLSRDTFSVRLEGGHCLRFKCRK